MTSAGGHGGGEPERRVATFVAALRQYHYTLDLMSDRAFERLDVMLADARAYAGAVSAHAPRGVIVDVGSGAGLPAAVIAAYHPERMMVWVERRRRRATFLRTVVARCGLDQVRVLEADVRRLAPAELGGELGAVTAQAVGGFAILHELTARLQGPSVTLIARRGGDWRGEIAALADRVAADVQVLAAEPLEGGGSLVSVRVVGGGSCP